MSGNLHKKLIIGTVLFGLILNCVITPAGLVLRTASAQTEATAATSVPTVDLNLNKQTLVQNQKTNTEKITTTLKQLAVMLVKKLIINRIVDMTAQWIQRGGFEGKGGPIVQDWNAFFKQAQEDAVGEIANKYVKFLCSPFKLNAALFLTPPPSSLDTKVACSLNNIVQNVDDFFKDFQKESQGRWIAYNTIWEPQNNYFGTILNLEDEKERSLAETLNQQNVKATVNLGFQPQVKCTKDSETGKDHCVTITPGQTIATKLIGPSTGELQTNSLLSSSDLSNYIGVLADAIIYRYQMLAVSGLQGMLGSKDATEQENADVCSRCAANPALSICSTASCMNRDLQERFDMIDTLTFNNSRTLYLDDVSTMIATKSNTRLAVNNALTTQNQLALIYENLDNCYRIIEPRNGDNDDANDIPVTGAQFEIFRNVTALRTSIDTVIDELNSRLVRLDTDIFRLQAAQQQFNTYSSDQTSSMDAYYANLVANGVIDVTTANTELSTAQNEATNYATALETQTTTDADEGGLRDLQSMCVPILLTASQ